MPTPTPPPRLSSLVLTRRINEDVMIGENGMFVRVLEARGGKVRLMFVAPADVRIDRREVRERNQERIEPS